MTVNATEDSRPLRKRNRRGEGSLLREEILVAATAILERTGSEEAVTLRGIAREVGIAAPSIAPHFAQRTDIIDAVVAKELAIFIEQIREASATETDPREKLFAMCKAYLSYGRTRPGRYRLMVGRRFVEDWQTEERPMVETAPLLKEAIALVTDAIEACIKSGQSVSVDAELDTSVLWFAMHGLVTVPEAITSLDWPDEDRLLAACVTSAARLK